MTSFLAFLFVLALAGIVWYAWDKRHASTPTSDPSKPRPPRPRPGDGTEIQ